MKSVTKSVSAVLALAALAFALFLPMHAQAVGRTNVVSQVTLAWNPVLDPSVISYNVYYGAASGVYTNVINAGSSTNAVVTPLVRGTTYFFAATSVNTNGLESLYSTEVSWTSPPLPPTPTNVVVLRGQ